MKIIHKADLEEYNDGKCEECGQEVDTVIEIGDDHTAWVCIECLRLAVKMLEAAARLESEGSK